MYYRVNVAFFRSGSGYSHDTDIETGDTDHFCSVQEWQRSWEAEDGKPLCQSEDEWVNITIQYWNSEEDWMWENPIAIMDEDGLHVAERIENAARDIIASGHFDAAAAVMDDELREKLHRGLAPCTDLEFLVAYMQRHEEKYGEEFVLP